jgi:hypothetical protein
MTSHKFSGSARITWNAGSRMICTVDGILDTSTGYEETSNNPESRSRRSDYRKISGWVPDLQNIEPQISEIQSKVVMEDMAQLRSTQRYALSTSHEKGEGSSRAAHSEMKITMMQSVEPRLQRHPTGRPDRTLCTF